MEAMMLGAEAECVEVEATASLPFALSAMSALGSPVSSKISSKLKCPGCMKDANLDLDFVKMEEYSGWYIYCPIFIRSFKCKLRIFMLFV